MKLLSEKQFERQNFIHYLRTGRFYYYEDYLNFLKKIEVKSSKGSKNVAELLKFIFRDKGEEDDDEPKEPKQPEEMLQDVHGNFLNPNKNYVEWEGEGDGCDTCSSYEGQIFEDSDAPTEPHPNCKCNLVPIDHNGKQNGDKKRPRKKCSRISSPKGERKNPGDSSAKEDHPGTDFGVPIGTSIISPVAGEVIKNDFTDGNGNRVAIRDENRIEHHFYHMNELSHLQPNVDRVEKGDLLGYSGNTGRSFGPHVHYETRHTDKYGEGKGGWREAVTEPKKEDIDYLDKHFVDTRGCPTDK